MTLKKNNMIKYIVVEIIDTLFEKREQKTKILLITKDSKYVTA